MIRCLFVGLLLLIRCLTIVGLNWMEDRLVVHPQSVRMPLIVLVPMLSSFPCVPSGIHRNAFPG